MEEETNEKQKTAIGGKLQIILWIFVIALVVAFMAYKAININRQISNHDTISYSIQETITQNEIRQLVSDVMQENINAIFAGITILLTLFSIILVVVPIINNAQNIKSIEKIEDESRKRSEKIQRDLETTKEHWDDSLNGLRRETDKLRTSLKHDLDDDLKEHEKKINELGEKLSGFENKLKEMESKTEDSDCSGNTSTEEMSDEKKYEIPLDKIDESIHNLTMIINQQENGSASYDIYIKRGLLFLRKGRLNEAIRDFHSAIIENPLHGETYYLLSKVHYNNNDYKEAWKDIEKAIDIDSGKVKYYQLRINIYMKMGLYEDARNEAYNRNFGDMINEIEKEYAENGNQIKQRIRINGNDIPAFEMILVEKGVFSMGATEEQGEDAYDDEKPVHRVLLSDFYIGKNAVTKSLWAKVMGLAISNAEKEKLATEITRTDITLFIKRLNAMTGRNFRLPSEAEWEYAARGGNRSRKYKYSGSNNPKEVAYYWSTSDSNSRKANELGICNMSGSVWEWCVDSYGPYEKGPQVNPIRNKNDEKKKVCRGGGYLSGARRCRVSHRRCYDNDYSSSDLGFRLAMEVSQDNVMINK